MTNKALTWIGVAASVGALLIAWKNRPLDAHPLVYAPYDPSTADLTSYGPQQPATDVAQNADAPSTAQINATDANSPTYAGWREPGLLSKFFPALTRRTWGVPTTLAVQSPSALPDLGIVKGQAPQNSDLLEAARVTDDASPSVTPDADLYPSADVSVYAHDVM